MLEEHASPIGPALTAFQVNACRDETVPSEMLEQIIEAFVNYAIGVAVRVYQDDEWVTHLCRADLNGVRGAWFISGEVHDSSQGDCDALSVVIHYGDRSLGRLVVLELPRMRKARVNAWIRNYSESPDEVTVDNVEG